MQLGTRWPFGATPPGSVPDSLRARIAAAEAARVGGDGEGRHWTLTWLEGRPIAELDDGTAVRPGATGEGLDAAASEGSDDDW